MRNCNRAYKGEIRDAGTCDSESIQGWKLKSGWISGFNAGRMRGRRLLATATAAAARGAKQPPRGLGPRGRRKARAACCRGQGVVDRDGGGGHGRCSAKARDSGGGAKKPPRRSAGSGFGASESSAACCREPGTKEQWAAMARGGRGRGRTGSRGSGGGGGAWAAGRREREAQ